MIKLNLLIIFLVIICITVYSQDYSQTVKGIVVDKDSKESLIGANVVLLNSNPINGATTDVDGEFQLKAVSVGRQSIKITYIGYKDLILPEILVISGKETVLNIELTENINQLQEVKIIASNQDKDKSVNTMATNSVRKINMDEAGRYAGGFYDPSRMVGSFAGVATVEGDGVNDIVIRGNSPRGMQWKLEGIEIPNPNHFTDGQGASGGAISIITSNSLSSSDFYTGAFPAEYGNAFSGIMDLNLRNGNQDTYESAFQFGVVGTEISLEGPFSKKHKASFLLNYRYSTFALLSQLKLIDLGNNNLPPKYQDLTLNLNFPTKKMGTFTLFSVMGESTTGTEPIKDSSQWEYREGRYHEIELHQMAVCGIKHLMLLKNKKSYIKTVIAATYQSDQWKEGILDKNYEKFYEYNDDFKYPSIRFSTTYNSKVNSKNVIRTGIVFSQLYYSMFAKEYDYSTNQYITLVNQNGNSYLAQTFAQWKHKFNEVFELNSGMHLLYFGLNSSYAVEPRLGLKWNINNKNAVNIGGGMHSRTESIASYMALVKQTDNSMIASNKNLDFTKAMHLVIGYDFSFAKNWRLKVEGYYQYLYNVPIEDRKESKLSALNFSYGIPDINLVNKGLGNNYGVELTLEKFYAHGYYCLLTTSIFDSKFKANNSTWFNTIFNCNYVANILGGKDFNIGKNKQNILGVNLKGLVRGGNRISPIDYAQTANENKIVFNENNMFTERLPDFYRIDCGTYFRINKSKYSYILSLDIQNIINRKNILGYEWSEKEQSVKDIEGIGLIPILNFRIEF